MRLRTDDDVFRVNSVWLGPPGYTFPWAARYTAYAVGIVVFAAVLLAKAILPGLDVGIVPVWEVVIAVLATSGIMALVDHDRPLASVPQTVRAEMRRTAPAKTKRTRVGVAAVRVEETS